MDVVSTPVSSLISRLSSSRMLIELQGGWLHDAYTMATMVIREL